MRHSILMFLVLGISIIFFDCSEDESLIIKDQIEKGSFIMEGRLRNYMVFLPNSYSNDKIHPMVIYLHGYDWTATIDMNYTKLYKAADKSDFIVVYPSGAPNWNSGIGDDPAWKPPVVDDVSFISALIDTVSNHYSIDLKRVYACGYSNGGFMSYKLASELSNRIAAIASVAGVMTLSTAANFNPLRPVPILHIHGTNDYWVSYAVSGYWKSVNQTLSYWTDYNNCLLTADTTILPDLDSKDGCTVEKITYTNCDNNANVILFKVIKGGHTWPGAGSPDFAFEGNANNDFDASVEILNFFKNYKLD